MSVLFQDDNTTPDRHPRAGQLSWLLDAGLITAAAVGVLLFTLDAHAVLDRSKPQSGVTETPDATPDPMPAAASLWHVKSDSAQIYLYAVPANAARDANASDVKLFQAFDGARAVWIAPDTAAPVVSRLTARAQQMKIATAPLAAGPDLAATLETQLKASGTVFVAIDPAQLSGPDGLVARLRHDGQIVSRLDPKNN